MGKVARFGRVAAHDNLSTSERGVPRWSPPFGNVPELPRAVNRRNPKGGGSWN